MISSEKFCEMKLQKNLKGDEAPTILNVDVKENHRRVTVL